jgi:anti-anti-sigma regulatory factor
VGEVGAETAGEMKTALLDGIVAAAELQIDLSGATDLDITAIQLLWAGKREAEKRGSQLVIAGGVPRCIRAVFQETGLSDVLDSIAGSTEKTPRGGGNSSNEG